MEQLARLQISILISSDADNLRSSVMTKKKSILISIGNENGIREPCQVKDVIGIDDRVSNSSGEEGLLATRASNTIVPTQRKRSGKKSLTNSMSTLTSSDRRRKLGW